MARISVYDGMGYSDHVMGTSDADEIYVRRTDATVDAYAGDDYILIAKDGDVIVNAGAGSDTIDAEGKYETINGGAGEDVINISNTYMNVDGGAGDDKINVSGLLYVIDHVTISGGAGNDLFRFNPTGATSYNPAGNTIDVVITDLSNGDSLRNAFVGDIGLEYSTSGGNVVLTEPGIGSVTITLQGVSDISQVADVVYRTKNEAKTLGEIFGSSSSSSSSESNSSGSSSSGGTSSGGTSSGGSTESTTTSTVPASGGGNTIINYYGDYNDFSGNNGTIINNSSIGGDVTNNTTVDNSTTIIKEGDTYIYSGGNKVINNYQQGEVVGLTSDYRGIDLNGNSFYVNSSSGQLEIQNARDKFIGYSGGDENVVAYSYVASGGGDVDGRGKSQAEIMIGGDNSDNNIYAGNGGSSLWGGNGGADTLVGGDGYDEFFFAIGSGGDVIQNSDSNDLVNLLGISLDQIAGVYVSQDQVHIDFTSGEFLQVKGNTNVGYRLQGETYVCNQSTGQWSTK